MNIFGKKKEGSFVCAMAKGQLKNIEKCCDLVFSEKMMGDGFIISPKDNDIVSPVDGEIIMLFPTSHAIGIKGDDGFEYLIHIGIETVALNGEGFTSHITLNQRVKKGQLLMQVDFETMKDKVKSTDVILLATDGRKCHVTKERMVELREEDVAEFK